MAADVPPSHPPLLVPPPPRPQSPPPPSQGWWWHQGRHCGWLPGHQHVLLVSILRVHDVRCDRSLVGRGGIVILGLW